MQIAMGILIGFPEIVLPNLLVKVLFFLDFIQSLIFSLSRYLGLFHSVENQSVQWPQDSAQITCCQPVSAVLIREILPVMKFEDMEVAREMPVSCAICLCELQRGQDIRLLKNCSHVFHRTCLERWFDHDQMTCPLCRVPFVPDELQQEFNQRLWAGQFRA